MKYDAQHKSQQLKAHEYLLKLIEREDKFEIKKISEKRSIKQNSYLHALINLFAIEYGERWQYVKNEFLKKTIAPEIFTEIYENKKTGVKRESWRSTAALDTAEMTKVIDMFRTWSSKELGIYLPSAEEYKTDWITYLQTIENNKEFL